MLSCSDTTHSPEWLSGFDLPPPMEGQRVITALRVIEDSAQRDGIQAMMEESTAQVTTHRHSKRTKQWSLTQLRDKGIVATAKIVEGRGVVLQRTPVGTGGVVEDERDTRLRFVSFGFQPSARSTQVAASMLPSILAVSTGLNSSIVCSRASSVDQIHSFFDRESRTCLALSCLEALLEDNHKRGYQCFMAIGAVDNGRDVVDLLAPRESSLRPLYVPLDPAAADGLLFPALSVHNITTGRRPAEALRTATGELLAMQDRCTVSKDADVFAIISVVAPPSDGGRTYRSAASKESGLGGTLIGRLTMLDLNGADKIANTLLPCVRAETRTDDIFLGRKVYPLLAFGVGFGSMCYILGTTTTHCTDENAKFVESLCEMRRQVVYPTNTAKGGSTADALFFEVCRLRRKVNERGWSSDQYADHEDLATQFEGARLEITRLNALLAERIPLVLDTNQFDQHTVELLNSRAELVRQLECEVTDRQEAVDKYRNFLLALPVITTPTTTATSGAKEGQPSAMSTDARLQLLERTNDSLKSENKRLKSLFTRDVAILKAELRSAQHLAALSTKAPSPFQPAADAFLEDIALVLEDPENSDSLAKALSLIQQLNESLTSTAHLMIDPGNELNCKPAVDSCQLVFKAAFDSLRRQLGVPISPPSTNASTTEQYYRELIFHRYACRAERHRLKGVAEALLLHVDRLQRALGDLQGDVDRYNTAYLAAGEQPSQAAPPLSSSYTASMDAIGGGRSTVNRLIADEMSCIPDAPPFRVVQDPRKIITGAIAKATDARPTVRRLTAVPLMMTMERTRGIIDTLELAARGVFEMLGKSSAVTSESLIYHRYGIPMGSEDEVGLDGGMMNPAEVAAYLPLSGGPPPPSYPYSSVHPTPHGVDTSDTDITTPGDAAAPVVLEVSLEQLLKPPHYHHAAAAQSSTPRRDSGSGLQRVTSAKNINRGFFSRVEESMSSREAGKRPSPSSTTNKKGPTHMSPAVAALYATTSAAAAGGGGRGREEGSPKSPAAGARHHHNPTSPKRPPPSSSSSSPAAASRGTPSSRRV